MSMKYEQTKDIGKSKSRAALWLKKNVMGFMPDTLITSIIVNHQGISEEAVSTLLSTMKSIYSALVDANLDKRIKVTTILSSTLIQDASSVPPSSSTKDLRWVLHPLLAFVSKTGSFSILNTDFNRDFAHSEEDLINSVVVAARNAMAFLHYPDIPIVINDQDMSCFQGLFFFPEAASLFFHNFCIYHIDAPGHELGAAAISSDIAIPTVDDLAEQVAEVLDYFGLGGVICMGVTAGAYILTLFALKYRERVLGLILISPLCQAPSWTEWFYNKVMMNFLYFYGMCGIVKESLLQRYFSQEVRCNIQGLESNIVQACRRLLDERQSSNVMRFMQVMSRRYDLTEGLKKLQCRTLISVGENSPFHSEAIHMCAKMDKKFNALVEVQACGSLVTKEQPHAMLIPIEYFLMGYGFYRPPPRLFCNYGTSPSPTSPLSPSCISAEF